MDQRLQVYLKEYEMLTAENRLWLTGTYPTLTIAFAACVGLAGAGVWENSYTLFLVIPVILLFLGFILLYQLNTIVLLGAQLAVLEERINALLGDEPALTYFSQTVEHLVDPPLYRHPQTGKNIISLNLIYGSLAVVVVVFGSTAVMYYTLPKLVAENPKAAVAYASTLGAAVVFFCLLLVKVAYSKPLYMDVIRKQMYTRGEQ